MNYPTEIKAFYMRLSDDQRTVAALDVLAPGIGEIIGGSQREERLEVLERRMDELGLDKEGYRWYLDLRRYGTVPHAGFGLGLERLVIYITGMRTFGMSSPPARSGPSRLLTETFDRLGGALYSAKIDCKKRPEHLPCYSVVPGRLATRKCIHALQGLQILLLWSRRSLPFPTLLRHSIATFVYRRKCLFVNLSKVFFVYVRIWL
jgi:hypothetical protein